MGSRTNLFEFATRELSHSAFWAWVLQATDPQERELEEVGRVGEAFLRRVGAQPPRDRIEVDTEHTLGGDAGRVDIHADIDGDAQLLIEHKVSAALQPSQLRRYHESADEKVHCVFLSTSYDLRKRRDEDGFEGFEEWYVLDADRLLEILGAAASSHPVVVDYREWLADRVKAWDELEASALSEDREHRKQALKKLAGQWQFMKHVTESFSEQGRQHGRPARTSGKPWTQFRFVENRDERDTLFYRVETLSDGPVFRLKQWQPNPSPSWPEKMERRDKLRTLWRECLDEVGDLDWARPTNRGRKSSAVARLNLLDHSASELADELAAVHPRFVARVKEEFEWERDIVKSCGLG